MAAATGNHSGEDAIIIGGPTRGLERSHGLRSSEGRPFSRVGCCGEGFHNEMAPNGSRIRLRRFSLLTLLIFLTACGDHRAPVIAVIPETTAQELWESEHAGVESAARPLHWKIYWNGPSREDDITRQMQLVDHAIADHVTGIILSPDHSLALLSLVHKAVQHNIPTVILGSRLNTESDALLSFVVNDDAEDGRLAAERAGRYLKPGDSVAVLGTDPYILSSVDRAEAFTATIHTEHPSVNVIERRTTSFNFAEGEEIAEQTIHDNPSLRVIVALSVIQTRGSYQALVDTGKLGAIPLIGCDQDLDLMFRLRFGGIDALIAQNTRAMGEAAVNNIAHQVATHSQPPHDLVVRPLLVTRENADTEAVQQVLDMNWTGQ
jgi:ribose transport system substrate-binding protein